MQLTNPDWRLIMSSEIYKGQRNQKRLRVRKLWIVNHLEDSGKPNPGRERFVSYLKKRYGYTDDLAVNELERLRAQFYKMYRDSGVPHVRSNFKHSHAT
jgi:hypothetical protein